MKEDTKPFFSVAIPLYNKEKHIADTIESVLSQSFQDFEIVIVNDGSSDNSVQIVESINDNRINLVHQANAGVSAARNKAITESKADYIAFLDADDLWLPRHLEKIHELINNFPDAGLYATAYKKRSNDGIDRNIQIVGLKANEVDGLIPNYFKSVADGDYLVCSSAVCIPKRVFKDKDVLFPIGEKFGEDQYVWARIAVQYDIAYSKEVTAIYAIETDNNTISAIENEIEPHQSFYMIRNLRPKINEPQLLKGFDKYISRIFYGFPLRNMLYRNKFYGLKQAFAFNLFAVHRLKLMMVFLLPKRILNKLIIKRRDCK